MPADVTIPNILTLIRILLTPVLIWLLLDHRFGDALLVFLLAGLTDGLDGLIARLFNQKSTLGAYLDPVADKLLLVSSFILLGALGLLPTWLVVVAVSRDAIIVLGVITLAFHGIPVEIRPSGLSKITTLFELITVFITLISYSLFPFPRWICHLLSGTVGMLCLVTMFQYIWRGVTIWETHRETNSNKRT
jgi:cardiolipin synthase